MYLTILTPVPILILILILMRLLELVLGPGVGIGETEEENDPPVFPVSQQSLGPMCLRLDLVLFPEFQEFLGSHWGLKASPKCAYVDPTGE